MKKLLLLSLISLLSTGCSNLNEDFVKKQSVSLPNANINDTPSSLNTGLFPSGSKVTIGSTAYHLKPAYQSASGNVCRAGVNANTLSHKLLICSVNGEAPWFVVPSVIASYKFKG